MKDERMISETSEKVKSYGGGGMTQQFTDFSPYYHNTASTIKSAFAVNNSRYAEQSSDSRNTPVYYPLKYPGNNHYPGSNGNQVPHQFSSEHHIMKKEGGYDNTRDMPYRDPRFLYPGDKNHNGGFNRHWESDRQETMAFNSDKHIQYGNNLNFQPPNRNEYNHPRGGGRRSSFGPGPWMNNPNGPQGRRGPSDNEYSTSQKSGNQPNFQNNGYPHNIGNFKNHIPPAGYNPAYNDYHGHKNFQETHQYSDFRSERQVNYQNYSNQQYHQNHNINNPSNQNFNFGQFDGRRGGNFHPQRNMREFNSDMNIGYNEPQGGGGEFYAYHYPNEHQNENSWGYGGKGNLRNINSNSKFNPRGKGRNNEFMVAEEDNDDDELQRVDGPF